MGQTQSKRSSTHSQTPLNPRDSDIQPPPATYADNSQASPLSPPSADDSITQPLPPQHLNRISALIDPQDLLGLHPEDFEANPYAYSPFPISPTRRRQARLVMLSPSGNTFSHTAYLTHPDRPLTIRERQQKVRLAMEKLEEARAEKAAMRPQGRTLSFRREKVQVTPVPTLGTVSELSPFEEARIEQGKREWEERQRVKEERKRRCKEGCLGECWGLCWMCLRRRRERDEEERERRKGREKV
ncbi:MAG: hypothetical protein Q9187_006403 [Circinaria calcarea]